MKQFLAILSLAGFLLYGGTPSLQLQTERLNKVLWENQKQFALTHRWVDLAVKHSKDMSCNNCWGDVFNDDHGSHIEILAQEDFPPSFPQGKRFNFQKEVLQHEVLHVVLTRLGVPGYAQDDLIEGLRPAMQQHWVYGKTD